MHAWLKRAVAGLLSAGTLLGGGLLTAGTANADEIRMPDIGKTITSLTASAATTYPRELVNGGFDYLPAGGWNVISPKLNTSRGKFTSVDPVNGQYIRNAYVTDGNVAWVKWDGFDASKFGWISDQKGGKPQGFVTDHANSVELQRDNDTDNTYAEIVGSEIGKSIYQKIDTQNSTDAVYTVRFDHAALSSEHADGMQALVNGKPVTMTRIGGNKAGDKTGWTGTDIVTHATNTDHYRHDGQWATYEGKVTIPANTPVSTFTFKSLNEAKPDMGNLIDNLTFKIAYRLSYDSNGGTKAKASQISSRTEGKASETDGKVKTVADDAAGSIPSNETAGAVKQAKSKTNGSVHLAADDDVAEYAANGLPDHLVNGTFDYRGNEIINENQRVYGRHDTTYLAIISAKTGIIGNPLHSKLDNWDSGKFGWKSNDDTAGADTVEVQRRNHTPYPTNAGNVWGEIAAAKRGKYIYQDIATTPGIMYRWSLKHASRNADQDDSMQVMIGMPGAEAVQEATRTTSNGTDKVGEKSTTITTHGTAQDGRWETYTGTYIATSTTTRFTFRSVRDSNGQGLDFTAEGNCVDDLSFDKAYRLGYDSNGGAKTGASKISANADGKVRLAADKSAEPESGTIADDRRVLTDTTARQDDGTSQRTITRSDGSVRVETIATTGAVSGCQVYYPAGTRITLATAKADSDCWDSSQIGKTSRTFYGWSANTDASDRDVPVGDTMDRNTLNANVRTEIVMPARAKTVYALWAINPTLSYNVNTPAGSNAPVTPASRTVPYNTAAPDTSGWQTGDTGKIPGYRFDGWYTAPNGGNKYDFNTPLTNNVTVYAHWVGNGYTVRFAGNGATGGSTPDQAYQYNIGQNLRRNGFVRDGYTFTGWKRADNQQAYGDGQWVTNLTTQPNGIVTMVAQWSANEAHIRYNPNPPAGKTTGGQGTPNWDGHTGDTPTIGQNGWTIDGYTFAGWATSPDGSGARYAPGARWTANGTLTLYAQWTPGQASLTYDGNGATGGKTDPQNGVTDQKVNVRQNGFTRDGYAFTGWNTQPDGRGQAWAPNAVWTLHGTGVLYALWRGNQQRLNYHGNGNTGGNTESQDGRTGDVLDTRANGFTRDGYEFVEWNTRADGTGDHYGKGSNGVAKWTMLPAGNDLYAIWQANPASIQYRDDWGATGSTPDTTGVTGQDVTIARNGFTRPGYTFTGWARDRRTNPSLQPGGRYTLTPGTTTLWAQWKADPAHLIYNANTGSTSQTHRTDGVVDQTLTVINNPFTRPGYTFTGWNTQADGRGRAYTAGNGFRLVADPKSNPVNTSVLYAQWRINRVTLKFNPNGGTGGYPDITVDAFTTVTIPADAKEPKVQRPGFRFTGWAMKPTPGAGDTILSPGKGTVSMPDRGSITVYAQWAPAMTTLPFTGGHAQVPTIGLYAGLAFMILAMGALMPVIRLRTAAARRGRHAGGTGTAGRHAR